MKNLLITAIVLVATSNISAQNINGRVFEILKDNSKAPIVGANIFWEGTTIGTITDKNGYYSIIGPDTLQEAILNVSYVGYTLHSKEILNNEYFFYLTSSINLNEVEINSNQATTKYSIISTKNIQTITSGEIAKAACCNLSECFETNASVDVNYSDAVSGIKTIKMLGLAGKYVKINNESLPLMTGLLNSYGLSYVPGSWIESIQILKGMGSVLNGHDAITGEINVEYFKPDDKDKIHTNLYFNSEGKLEKNFIYNFNKNKWQSNLFTHISYLGREIDHNGKSHEHTNHNHNQGDGFLDTPKLKLFNILNRWKYVGDNLRSQFYIKLLTEDREGGQKSNFPEPRYIVGVYNDLFEFSAKNGYVFNNEKNQSIGIQSIFKLHSQDAQFGNNILNSLQEKIYINLIAGTDLLNSNHTLNTGFSFNHDKFKNYYDGNIFSATFNNNINLNTDSVFYSSNGIQAKVIDDLTSFERKDLVSGLYLEYNYSSQENLNLNIGLRSDYYNITSKFYFSPRLNFKYNPSDKTVIRLSAGKGFRISNSLIENMNYMASSRRILVDSNILPEEAWNLGGNFAYCFYLFSREGILNFDYYRTIFTNKIMLDITDANSIFIYDESSNSQYSSPYSNTLQLDLSYEFFNRFFVKSSYKLIDNKQFGKSIYLSPKNRGLLNFTYSNLKNNWKFDYTINRFGENVIPNYLNSSSDIFEKDGDFFTNPFYVHNSQVTYSVNDFDVYLGGENILNFVQENHIVDYENPFGNNFDASLIYAPVMGRLFYMGLRYKVK